VSGTGDGERYDGEYEAAARQAYLARQRNLARGWQPGGPSPADLLRQLDGQYADPVELRALARMREAERLRDGRTTASDALRWLAEHGPEAAP
jgi:hypothetical protein